METTSGKSFSIRYGGDGSPAITIADIKTDWGFQGGSIVSFGLSAGRRNIGPMAGQKKLEFAIVKAEDLSEIEDPTKYKYKTSERAKVSISEEIIILRLYKKYAVIRPIAINVVEDHSADRRMTKKEVDTSKKDMAHSPQGKKIADKIGNTIWTGTITVEEKLTYEWKYFDLSSPVSTIAR